MRAWSKWIVAVVGVLLLLSVAWRGAPSSSARRRRVSHDASDWRARARLPGFVLPVDVAASIEGVVVDERGRPTRAARVAAVLRDPWADARDLQPLASMLCDSDGRFRLDPLPPGNYQVTATLPAQLPAQSGDITLAIGEHRSGVTLRLGGAGATIIGIVNDAGGGAVGGARIRAVRLTPDEPDLFLAIADDSGTYRITVPAGAIHLVADADGYASADRRLNVVGDQRADFSLYPSSTLRGRVVDGAGVAVADAVVALIRSGIDAPRTLMSGSDGRFEFRDLDPGEYDLDVHSDDRVGQLDHPLTLGMASTSEVRVVVRAGRQLAGMVRGSDGRAINHAAVYLTPEGLGAHGQRHTECDESGRYTLQGIVPGRYQLMAEADGMSPTVRDNVLIDVPQAIDLTLLPAGEVRGHVVASGGAPVAGATVRGNITASAKAHGAQSWWSDRSDEHGAFVLRGLGEGALVVHAEHAELGRGEAHDQLTQGARKELTVTLAAPAGVAGHVFWTDRTPAGGVSVRVTSQRETLEGVTDANGAYRIAPLPDGEVVLQADRASDRPSSSSRGRVSLRLAAGEQRANIDLEVARGGHRIRGVVRAADDAPVADCTIRARRLSAAPATDATELATYATPNGDFMLEDLEPGSYRVIVSAVGFVDASSDDVAVDGAPLHLQLQRAAHLRGTVLRGREPQTDYELALVSHEDGAGAPRRLAVHDPAGAFAVDGLKAGTYTVSAASVDGASASADIVVEGGRDTNAQLVLADGVDATARLVDWQSRQPLGDVQAIATFDGHRAFAYSDEHGVVKLTGLPPDRDVTLYLRKSDIIADERMVAIDASATNDLGEFELMTLDPAREGRAGIGVVWTRHAEALLAIDVSPTGPGARAGIAVGDILETIDGRDVTGLGERAVNYRLWGPAGTTVTLGLYGVEGPRQLAVTREDPDATVRAP